MKLVSVAVAMLLVFGCASEPSIDTRPDADLSFDGLSPISNSVFRRAWIDPDVDLSQYNKILLGETEFQFRTVKETQSNAAARHGIVREFYISEQNRTKLIETVTGIFREELESSQSFTLTDQPAPDTLILVGGLTDIVSRVPPQRTGKLYLQSLGEATLVFELRDSLSGETLYRAADRKRIARQEGQIRVDPVTTWKEVDRWARRWAVRVREGLDAVHE
jgi:hypothetical protein